MRSLFKVALLALVLGMGGAMAQQRTLVVSGFGLNQNLIDKNITRPFEARCNCKVVWDVGNNADRLAKLVARKDNPNVDVVLMTDLFALQAARQNLFIPLEASRLRNYDRLFDFAKNPIGGNFGVGFTVFSISIVYRTDKITTPIRSWKDLWRPELARRVILPNITTSSGLPLVSLLNRVWGGTQTNDNPGFAKLTELKPRLLTLYNTSAQVASLFAQDEIWAAPVGRFAWGNLVRTGKPLAWALPVEGQPGVINTASIVRGTRNTDLAYQFIDFILSDEVQLAQAIDLVDSPTNKAIRVPADKAEQLTADPILVRSLRFSNFDYLLGVQSAWIDRWNREIAR